MGISQPKQSILVLNKDYTNKSRVKPKIYIRNRWTVYRFEASVNFPIKAFFTIQTALHASLASAKKTRH
jgi:hypothetical protein